MLLRWKKSTRKRPQATRKKKRNHEDEEQRKYWHWFDSTFPDFYELAWHTPNGGLRNPITASLLKLMGVKPGTPDNFIAIPRGRYHGLFIEMKRRKVDGRSSVSRLQKKSIASLMGQGYQVLVCYGYEHAKTETINYLEAI